MIATASRPYTTAWVEKMAADHVANHCNPLDKELKAPTLTWKFMFARSMLQTDDRDAQYALLNRVSELLDIGTLVSTANHHGGKLSEKNLLGAHPLQ